MLYALLPRTTLKRFDVAPGLAGKHLLVILGVEAELSQRQRLCFLLWYLRRLLALLPSWSGVLNLTMTPTVAPAAAGFAALEKGLAALFDLRLVVAGSGDISELLANTILAGAPAYG